MFKSPMRYENNGKNLSSRNNFIRAQIRKKMLEKTKAYLEGLKKDIAKMEKYSEEFPEVAIDLLPAICAAKTDLHNAELDYIDEKAIDDSYNEHTKKKWREGLMAEFREN